MEGVNEPQTAISRIAFFLLAVPKVRFSIHTLAPRDERFHLRSKLPVPVDSISCPLPVVSRCVLEWIGQDDSSSEERVGESN